MGGRDPTFVRRVLGTAILANPGRSMGNQRTRDDVDSETWRNFNWGGRLSGADSFWDRQVVDRLVVVEVWRVAAVVVLAGALVDAEVCGVASEF